MHISTVIIIALTSLVAAAPGTLLDTAAPLIGRMADHDIRDAARGAGNTGGNTKNGNGNSQSGGGTMQNGGSTQGGAGNAKGGGGKTFTGIATFNRYADQTNTVCGPMTGTSLAMNHYTG